MAFSAQAQLYLHQVFVLNEGWSDWQTGEVLVQPTLGVYDPALDVYQTVLTIEGAGFISDAIISNGALFVAADGQILKYDADSYELLASAEVIGVRQLAERGGMIYATRGDVDEFGMNLPLDSYLQWFHADDLMWAGELTTANGPAYATEGLAWSGDRLYIAVNNAFDWGNEVGFIGEWDMTSDTYTDFDLGEEGKNPNRLFVNNGQIITVNNRDYGSASLSEVMTSNGTVQTHAVADATAGCLAAAVFEGELKYQITGENAVRTSALGALNESTTWLDDAPAFYGAAIDPVSGKWYGSVTDYTTYGLVEIRDEVGGLLSSFDCGVSPGVICMDVRNASDISSIAGDSESAVQGDFDLLGRGIPNLQGRNGWFIDASGNKSIQLGW
ncbi:MAG: hypothetical protein CMD33_04085 [Flavobacteriales bacterium]|nr:hypothetical protein [Flavobacteriales bacterium]